MTEARDDVASSLKRIVDWFGAGVDQPDLKLGSPATAEQLKAAEDSIGAALPGPVRAAYGVANGQAIDATHPLFPDANWWVSLEGLLSDREVMVGLFEGDDSEEFGKEWWHPGLIAVTQDGSGDGVYVDLDGRNDGVVGEVIQFVHDDWPSQRTERVDPTSWATDANGFDSMLRRYAGDLEAGRYRFDGRFLVCTG